MTMDVSIRAEVLDTLERFKRLVSARSMDVVAEFAADGKVLLIGSEANEIASGLPELQAFFARIFSRDDSFSWEWSRVDVAHAGSVAWFFADGQVVVLSPHETKKAPYRLTGVLERAGSRWVWRQFHGAEPA